MKIRTLRVCAPWTCTGVALSSASAHIFGVPAEDEIKQRAWIFLTGKYVSVHTAFVTAQSVLRFETGRKIFSGCVLYVAERSCFCFLSISFSGSCYESSGVTFSTDRLLGWPP